MFKPVESFSGFSVDNLDAAKNFYNQVLGLQVEELGDMGVHIHLPGNDIVFMYPKGNHKPATYTMLNFVVSDIDEAVDSLTQKGVVFERYEQMSQDEKGIARGLSQNMGPDIAWFKDPAGNILAVLQQS